MTVKKTAVAEDVESFSFEYDGYTYSVAPSKTWPFESQEAEESGRYAEAAKLILGEKQYKVFKSKPRTVGDFGDLSKALFEAAAAHQDSDLGE